MKRLFIGIVILIAVLVGGFVAAIVTLNSIDWSEYEEPIAKAVKDSTGRELRFSGALNVNIGLSPGISAKGITLQNADWASREDMLTLEQVEAHLKLIPLVFGQIELSRLEIIGLDVMLETDQQGRGNWEFGSQTDETPAIAESDPASSSAGETLLTGAFLKKAVIRDASVVFRDGVANTSQSFSIVELVARMESASAPLVLDLEAAYGEESIGLQGEFARIAGVLTGGALDFDMTASAIGANLEVDGSVAKPLDADGIDISVNASGDSLSRLLSFAGVSVADLGEYRISANVAGNAESIALTDLVIGLDAAGAKINATGRITDVVAVEGIDVDLGIKGGSLAALSGLAGSEIPDLGAYSLRANVTGTAGQLTVTNLVVDIADTKIDGDLSAKIAAEPMRLEATLRSPRIDLTRLLPADDSAEPAPARASGPVSNANERLFPDDPLPLDALDALDTIDAVISLTIGELIVDPETTISNLDTVINAAPKTLSVELLSLETMDATVDGRIGLDVRKKVAAVAAKLNIRHPSIGDFVEDEGDTMLTGGPLDMDIDITGVGGSVRKIMASMNGSLALEMGTAKINNKWVQRAFADAKAILKKKGDSEPIDLHCITTEFRITDGIAVPESLVIDTRGISLFGDGNINLRNESMDLEFDRLASSVSASSALPPFKVRGTFSSPTGAVDAKALGKKALGFGAALLTKSDVDRSNVSSATGPERCRQRLVVYEQVQEDRALSKEKTAEVAGGVAGKAAETTKGVLGKVGGFFRKKKNAEEQE